MSRLAVGIKRATGPLTNSPAPTHKASRRNAFKSSVCRYRHRSMALKGEAGARAAGKLRAEGKPYVVKDGDVMNFLFN